MKAPRSSPAALTLTETLFALVLLSLLLAFLLPALMRTRQASATAQCVTQLRKVGQGFLSYAQENNGSFPPHWGTRQGEPASISWHGFVAPYVTGQAGAPADPCDSVFYCPTLGPEVREGKSYRSTAANAVGTYGFNYFHLSSHSDLASWSFRLPQLTRPARVVLAGDAMTGSEPSVAFPPAAPRGLYPGSAGLPMRHPGKRVNLVYADGHVVSVETRLVLTPGEEFIVGSWDPRW